MRYIKKFESFKTNEEVLDFMTFPADVDFAKGSADMWSDILDGLWNMVQKFFKGAKDFFIKGLENSIEWFFKVFDFKNNVKQIIKKIEVYFGKPAAELTHQQVFDTLMDKNKDLLKESREQEMKEYSEKSIAHKAGTVIQTIFGVNAVGGLVVCLAQWISETALSFDLLGWAKAIGLSSTLANPGAFGFCPAWFILSIVAILIIALIKKADAYLSTDKGIAGKIYNPFK